MGSEARQPGFESQLEQDYLPLSLSFLTCKMGILRPEGAQIVLAIIQKIF